jgi:murein DD-endopeptidase MepM/ murein hydrolase activator NlpD
VPSPPTRRWRRLVVVATAALAVTGAVVGAGAPPAVAWPPAGSVSLPVAAGGTAFEVRHQPPVPGEVWRPFEPPGTAYGAGHRGVDLAAQAGDPIRASAPGTVVHAGAIAGTTWVSIDHADGLRTAYGPLATLQVEAGRHVDSAEVIGTLAPGGHGHEHRDRGLHFSVRRDGVYLDPLGVLAAGGRPSLAGPGSTSPLSRPASEQRPAGRAAVPGPPMQLASTSRARR